MDLILAIILLMIAGWLTNAFKASLFLCLGSVLTLSGAFFLIGFVSQTFFLVMLALSLLTGCVMGIAPLRRLLVTGPIYKATRRSTKSISETEKIALSAGDSWLEADIFQGKLDLKKVLASEVSSLSKQEQYFLDNETEELCKLIDDWKIMNSDYDLDPKTWAYINS